MPSFGESTQEHPLENGNERLDRLGDGTDLVDLEEETVASLLLNGAMKRRGEKSISIIG